MFESLSSLNRFDVICGLAGLRFRLRCLSPTQGSLGCLSLIGSRLVLEEQNDSSLPDSVSGGIKMMVAGGSMEKACWVMGLVSSILET